MRKLFRILLLAFAVKMNAQSPVLQVKNADSLKVRLSEMYVEVKIVGNIAYTTSEMHFFNASPRVLEAELLFPLPDGVSVSGYAIDINGKMRDAVPVNKSKAKQVYEAVINRRVDPGLLEKVDGNNFKTRIYPLQPNNKRIVRISYEQELSYFDASNLQYLLLSKYPKAIDKFSLKVQVNSTNKPVENSEIIDFSKTEDGSFSSVFEKNNFLPSEKTLVKIPVKLDVASVYSTQDKNENYFYASMTVDAKVMPRKAPKSIRIIWDNSFGVRNRNLKDELAFLEAYFSALQNVEVSLYSLNNNCENLGNYTIANGNWDGLKNALTKMKYDGASKFSSISFGTEDETLFFTDGLSSLSSNAIMDSKNPLYAITNNASSDFSYLKYITAKNGGCLINLLEDNLALAMQKLQNSPLQFLGYKDNYLLTEVYPLKGATANNSFSVSGISLQKENKMTLLFGYNGVVSFEKDIEIKAQESQNLVDVKKLWAQKKIAVLEIDYKKNAEEIELMGKKYGIVTKNTSLIVLETVQDYMRYDVLPPAELREEFDRLMKQNPTAKAETVDNSENLQSNSEALKKWWKKNIKYTKTISSRKPKIKRNMSMNHIEEVGNGGVANIASPPQADSNATEDNAVYYSIETVKDKSVSNVEGSIKKADVASTSSTKKEDTTTETYKRVNYDENIQYRSGDKNNNATVSGRIDKDDSIIELKPEYSDNKNYMTAIQKVEASKKYLAYLDLRKVNEYNTAFYFDMATYFYKQNDSKTAITILSNIAELGLENHQLYKTLIFALRQFKMYDDAEFVAQKVIAWRPFEPQGYRDLAMIYEEKGEYQKAFDTLQKCFTSEYLEEMRSFYEGLEDIILMDMNRLVSNHKINIGKFDKKLLAQLPVDLRIVLNWSIANTDIDLHVIEPTGEECYYSNTATEIGGRFSKDFTTGYGPEQYLLRNAIKGKYEIKTNFYNENQMNENGPASVLVEIYAKKAGKIEKKLKMIQLSKIKENGVLAVVNF